MIMNNNKVNNNKHLQHAVSGAGTHFFCVRILVNTKTIVKEKIFTPALLRRVHTESGFKPVQ